MYGQMKIQHWSLSILKKTMEWEQALLLVMTDYIIKTLDDRLPNQTVCEMYKCICSACYKFNSPTDKAQAW